MATTEHDTNTTVLTAPQRALLAFIAEQGSQGGSIWGSRGVGRRLAEKGLIEYVGNPRPFHVYRATEAGMAALQDCS